MGAGHTWKCSTCGYKIEISGLWEFYRDRNGNRNPYGHPTPSSEEAKEMGVKGFTSVEYCPKCRKVREVIVKEYEKPIIGGGHWGSKEPAVEYEALCPKCGTGLEDHLNESDVCPKCNKGNFEISDLWVS
ncbi:hypothetical protein ACFLWS_02790 [Chloroflexota bacterium]